jgi:cell division protein FtsW
MRKQPIERNSELGKLMRNPVKTLVAGFDRYFLHQTWLFYRLVMLILLFIGFGLLTVLSSSNVDSIKASGNPFGGFQNQLLYVTIGLALLIFISTRSISLIDRFSKAFYAVSVIMQTSLLIPGVGVEVNGNKNWIRVFNYTIQPSEFMKLGMILIIAQILSQNRDRLWDFKSSGWPVLGYGFGSAIWVVAISKDLGTALVMIAIVFAMIFLAGMPWTHLAKFLLVAGVGVLGAVAFVPNRVLRIFAFIPTIFDPHQADWQSKHGMWALASGGLSGVGPGKSTLNWGWIPEIENDYIFANIAEEWGMLGALLVIVLFVLLGFYMRKIALNSGDDFSSLVTMGVMFWILIQAVINISVVLDLLPVLGVPLPLFSKGGSSIVALLMALGVVLAFERVQAPAASVSRRG